MLEDFSKNKFKALILGLPVSDTLKQSDNKLIKSTISRQNVWRALTPQLFDKESLKIAYNSSKEDLSNITDEASLFDNLDQEVMIMQGSAENIKITFQEDLKLAETILLNQKRIRR
jgi:2-C-methyl-D-erythritol 4-phosphate cytidylyltransferase